MGLRFPYFMSYAGWRGTLHKAGLRRETGLHIRGWNLGVRVCTGKYRAPEEITLIMTAGTLPGTSSGTHTGPLSPSRIVPRVFTL